ncbi:MAG: hypothetical protein ACR2FV_08185 [Ornithinimicrobium sp.]|uniref:SCO3933 family regulatory protein n=1 Tax=Ornithinimicrobium sp. TaxID=1977084 RepID=UPI003D9B5000
MRLPIDTSAMTFVVAGAAEPVLDFESKQQKTDENGAPLFAVAVMVLGDRQPEIFSIKLGGQPVNVTPGQTAKVAGLIATPWSMGERSGVSFRATSIEPATAPSGRQSGS